MKSVFKVVSGGFLLLGAAGIHADQVILDDLIVDGSACIGFDCVNGESFGFDTIRIKENNLRIRAVDTSSSASFPSNDWQITFNDSANGGVNKFSIDDIDAARTPFTIEAGAPSNSLYVDDGGRLGLGTSTPVVDVHIKSGNTPTMRLEQDGSSGFTPQTWDVAGNEANFFIRDVTNGSTLPFRIFPGAPSNALTIAAGGGDIGIGTTLPEGVIHIKRVGTVLAYIQSSDNGAVQLRFRSDNGNRRLLAVTDDNTVETQIIFGNTAIKFAGATDSGAGLFATLDATGLNVNGNIQTTVSGVVHADYVFERDFKLQSIDQHADQMWQNKHLPAVGPGVHDENGSAIINVGEKTIAILEELEIAHIYIAQLHTKLGEMEARMAELEKGSNTL